MNAFVADTHSLIWHLQRSTRLSSQARALFQATDGGTATAWLSTVTLVEMVYLAEKNRIAMQLVGKTLDLLRDDAANYQVVPLDLNVAAAVTHVPRQAIADMPDRIIVATALHLGLPLLSRDGAFAQVPGLHLIW